LASAQIIVFLEKSIFLKKQFKEIIFEKEKCKIFLKYFAPFSFLKWNLQNQLIIRQTRSEATNILRCTVTKIKGVRQTKYKSYTY
jgi:hypothetical protein